MYLAATIRPTIAYAVHQCALFSCNPKNIHALAIKQILHYLQKIQNKDLLMHPVVVLLCWFRIRRDIWIWRCHKSCCSNTMKWVLYQAWECTN